MKKKSLVLLMAICLIVVSVFCFSGCDKKDEYPKTYNFYSLEMHDGKIYEVGDVFFGGNEILTEEKMSLTLNSDGTCTLKPFDDEEYVTFSGTYNDKEFTINDAIENYDGTFSDLKGKIKIEDEDVYLTIHVFDDIYEIYRLKNAKTYAPTNVKKYKSISIGDIVGIGDIAEVLPNLGIIVTEDMYTLSIYEEKGTFAMCGKNKGYESIYGKYTQEGNVLKIENGKGASFIIEDNYVGFRNNYNPTQIIFKFVEKSAKNCNLTTDKIVGNYKMRAVLNLNNGTEIEGYKYVDGYNCNIELKSDSTFTIEYTTPTKTENYAGEWTYDNAGEITLSAENLPDCATKMTVSDFERLGILFEEGIYCNLEK